MRRWKQHERNAPRTRTIQHQANPTHKHIHTRPRKRTHTHTRMHTPTHTLARTRTHTNFTSVANAGTEDSTIAIVIGLFLVQTLMNSKTHALPLSQYTRTHTCTCTRTHTHAHTHTHTCTHMHTHTPFSVPHANTCLHTQ